MQGRKRVYEVVRRMTAEELNERISRLEKDLRMIKRLYFTGYNWLKILWDEIWETLPERLQKIGKRRRTFKKLGRSRDR